MYMKGSQCTSAINVMAQKRINTSHISIQVDQRRFPKAERALWCELGWVFLTEKAVLLLQTSCWCECCQTELALLQEGRTDWTAACCVRLCVHGTLGGISSSSSKSLPLFFSHLLLFPHQLYCLILQVQGYQASPKPIIHACTHRCQYQ